MASSLATATCVLLLAIAAAGAPSPAAARSLLQAASDRFRMAPPAAEMGEMKSPEGPRADGLLRSKVHPIDSYKPQHPTPPHSHPKCSWVNTNRCEVWGAWAGCGMRQRLRERDCGVAGSSMS